MTGGEMIRAALIALPGTSAGTKIRQDAADVGDKYPFIIFRRMEVERILGLDNSMLAARETFHIECWGETRAQADLLEDEVIAALGIAGIVANNNDNDGLDPEVRVRAAVLVADIWTC